MRNFHTRNLFLVFRTTSKTDRETSLSTIHSQRSHQIVAPSQHPHLPAFLRRSFSALSQDRRWSCHSLVVITCFFWQAAESDLQPRNWYLSFQALEFRNHSKFSKASRLRFAKDIEYFSTSWASICSFSCIWSSCLLQLLLMVSQRLDPPLSSQFSGTNANIWLQDSFSIMSCCESNQVPWKPTIAIPLVACHGEKKNAPPLECT